MSWAIGGLTKFVFCPQESRNKRTLCLMASILKIVVTYIFSDFFVCFSGKVNQVPLSSSCPKKVLRSGRGQDSIFDAFIMTETKLQTICSR